MFTIHYNSTLEELDAIQLGDVVGYGGGLESKVIKITKELTSTRGYYYVFYFEDGKSRPIIVLKYASQRRD